MFSYTEPASVRPSFLSSAATGSSLTDSITLDELWQPSECPLPTQGPGDRSEVHVMTSNVSLIPPRDGDAAFRCVLQREVETSKTNDFILMFLY